MEGLGNMGMKWERCGALVLNVFQSILCVWNCVNVILCEIWWRSWRSWNVLLKDTGIEKMIWVIRFTYGSFLFIVQDESNLHCLVLTLNGAFKRLTVHSSWNRWVEMGFPMISHRFGDMNPLERWDLITTWQLNHGVTAVVKADFVGFFSGVSSSSNQSLIEIGVITSPVW